jgi:hypothetical protein
MACPSTDPPPTPHSTRQGRRPRPAATPTARGGRAPKRINGEGGRGEGRTEGEGDVRRPAKDGRRHEGTTARRGLPYGSCGGGGGGTLGLGREGGAPLSLTYHLPPVALVTSLVFLSLVARLVFFSPLSSEARFFPLPSLVLVRARERPGRERRVSIRAHRLRDLAAATADRAGPRAERAR